MKTLVRRAILALVVLLVAIQLVPIDRTNPPVESDVAAPPEVKAILRRACYDCHSNETRWIWTSRIAPGSFLVAHDVAEAREHLNFSRWGAIDEDHRAALPKAIREEVNGGDMPPLMYTVLHPEARLTDAERARVVAWAQTIGTSAADPAAAAAKP